MEMARGGEMFTQTTDLFCEPPSHSLHPFLFIVYPMTGTDSDPFDGHFIVTKWIHNDSKREGEKDDRLG